LKSNCKKKIKMIMKKIKLIALVAMVSFASCQDAVDITQPSELTPDRAYETVGDMRLGLNGVYAAIPGEGQIYFTSLFTDEVALGRANGGQGTDGELAFMLNNTSGDAASIWLSNYAAINFANRLILGGENVLVEAGSPEEAEKNDILAQAHAIRAFANFQLLSYFSEDIQDDSSLGVILLDYVPNNTDQSPRSTTGEIFEFIESDLDFVDANLVPTLVTNRTYIGQNFVTAFRARMAAYRGDYATAKTYVDQLDAIYNLTPKAQYPAIWLDTETAGSEVIFKLERTRTAATGNFYQFWSSVNSTVNGSPFFEVNRALFNLVNNPLDVRRFVIADATSLILSNYNDPSVSDADYKQNDVLPVGKYTVTESQNLLADVKVFRFSEMVLIRAEYYASINDFANVAAEIGAIRTARFGSVQTIATPANAQEAWALILTERRVELAFEGHRYIDLRRLGPLANANVDRDPRDCAFNGFCTLSSSDYRFIMPIPLSESVANPTIQQNPGY
jgi:hypothetical protein